MARKEKIDASVYCPPLLYKRLQRRSNLKLFGWVNLFFNVILVALGGVFIESVWKTRMYIGDGNAFWDIFKVKGLKQNELQSYCAFTAIFTIVISAINSMNDIVILFHGSKGGLKIRLQFAMGVNILFSVLILIYALIVIIKFADLVILFPIYIGIVGAMEISSIFLSVMIWRVVDKELEYMLSYDLMLTHKEEYYKEKLALVSKKHENEEVYAQRYDHNEDANEKILLNK